MTTTNDPTKNSCCCAPLSAEAHEVMRNEGTERPFSSPLNNEKRKGIFHCAACGTALFNSDTKFNSGTGWPSFFDVLPDAIDTKTDHKLGMPRTEYHCKTCNSHQGHVFPDGPAPTGLRYCNNGVALRFVPDDPNEPSSISISDEDWFDPSNKGCCA